MNHWKTEDSIYLKPSEFRRVRELRLLEEKYTCQVCGERAKVAHHIDKTKTNHAKENILIVCYGCHRNTFHSLHQEQEVTYEPIWKQEQEKLNLMGVSPEVLAEISALLKPYKKRRGRKPMVFFGFTIKQISEESKTPYADVYKKLTPAILARNMNNVFPYLHPGIRQAITRLKEIEVSSI